MKVSGKFLASCASTLFLFSLTVLAQNSSSFTISSGLVAQLGPRVLPGQRGLPYSAIKETQTLQTLSDGTHITRKSHTRFYRDSQGRTRTEIFLVGPGISPDQPTQILINDPIEGVNYFLNPRNHTGTRTNFRMMVPQQPPPRPPANMPAPPPPKQSAPQPNREDLGMQMIEGLWARGSRITRTIPINAEGNDRPLVNVTEAWFSEELQADVLTKLSDPRGETVVRLTNIERSEPDPALFRPPADYTLAEQQPPIIR
jgi:hypothetical protein